MHVVAHQPTQTSVLLWVQTDQSETGWTLQVVGPGAPPAPIRAESGRPVRLTNVLPGQSPISIWTHPLTGLTPGADYRVWVEAPFTAGRTEAATFRTLPADLAEPFTVLLGSCYCEDSDLSLTVKNNWLVETLRRLTQKLRRGYVTTRSALRREIVGVVPRGNVSRRYKLLCDAAGRPPDVKILCGDQVYLDTPVVLPMTGKLLARRISRTYSRTWDKLGYLLSHGANMCASDDHEFWNNYPYRPKWYANLPGLLGPRARAEWEATAREFIAHVQQAPPMARFDLGADLSVLVVDTRIHRDQPGVTDAPGNPKFMLDADFDQLLAWLGGLTSPGVLVLGQPVLARTGNDEDRNLPDFPEQYARLCRALAGAPRDVLVLSGDVHFGRVAEVELPRPDGRPGRMVEVISSPMALVSLFGGRLPLAAGRFAADILTFPTDAGSGPTDAGSGPDSAPTPDEAGAQVAEGAGAAGGRVRYFAPVESTRRRCEDHYMTLRFSRSAAGAGVDVEVVAHLLRSAPSSGPARTQAMATVTLGGPAPGSGPPDPG